MKVPVYFKTKKKKKRNIYNFGMEYQKLKVVASKASETGLQRGG
jgi:hypothetical protein